MQTMIELGLVNSQATHDLSQATHDLSQTTHDLSQATHDLSQATHDLSQATHDLSQTTHDLSQTTQARLLMTPQDLSHDVFTLLQWGTLLRSIDSFDSLVHMGFRAYPAGVNTPLVLIFDSNTVLRLNPTDAFGACAHTLNRVHSNVINVVISFFPPCL